MRRHLLATATLTLLLTAVPASAALAGERTGDPVEEADDTSEVEDGDDARDRDPSSDDDGSSGDADRSDGESEESDSESEESDDEADADRGDDPEADEPPGCRPPEVTREYTAEAMVMTADLDLRGCDWWDGSSLNLVGIIGRDDGSEDMEGNVAFQAVTCTDEARLRNDPDPGWKVVGCAIELVLPHPPAEVAYYYGGISFTWEDGLHRVDLETTCTSWSSGTVCRDDLAPAVRGPGIRT
jgi:hypothetical protein